MSVGKRMDMRVTGAHLAQQARLRFDARRAAWAALGAILSLAACSSSGGLDATSPSSNALISVTPASSTVVVGSTVTLQAEVKDASGQVVPNPTLFWSSSDTSVATVTSAGIVTARSVGTAQVAASTGGVSAVAAITVVQAPVASVSVVPGSGTVTVGAHLALQAVTTDASGATLSGRPVVWATSAPQVATVDGNGVVTGVAAGTATISAASEGKSGTASITVTVIAVGSVAVSPTSASLTVGQTVALNATALDASGNVLAGRQISWASSNNSVAKVSAQGLVTALAGGTATITATSEGKSASALVVVAAPAPSPPPVASVVVTPSSGTLTVGGTLALAAATLDASGAVLTGRGVTWSSSATSVASVSSSGVVTALAPGSATITATSDGKSGSASITVQAPAPPAPTVAKITISPPAATIKPGKTRQFTATPTDANGNVVTGVTVTWSVSDTSLVSLSVTGATTMVASSNSKRGTVTITAAVGSVTGNAFLTVQ